MYLPNFFSSRFWRVVVSFTALAIFQLSIDKHEIFKWIPSHIGIHGNTVIDQEAKNALDDTVSKATNFKARRIALASELKIKLNRPAVRKQLPILLLSPSFEPSVYIAEYSDVTDLISAKCY
jgi:hypothetical protein